MNDPNLFPHTLATAIDYTIGARHGQALGRLRHTNKVWTLTALGSLPNPTGGTRRHEDHLEDRPGQGNRARRDRAGVEPLHPRRREHLLHDRHRDDPGAVASRGPMCLVRRRQRRRELDRRCDHGRRRHEPHRPKAADVASAWRTAPTVATRRTGRMQRLRLPGDDRHPAGRPTPSRQHSERQPRPHRVLRRGQHSEHRDYPRDPGRDRPETRTTRTSTTRTCSCSRRVPRPESPTTRAGRTGRPADGTATYGGPTDLWGTTWTPAQINASNFGVRLQGGQRQLGRAHGLDQPHPHHRHVLRPFRQRRSGSSGEPDPAGRHRRHVQAEQRDCRTQPARAPDASTRRRSRARRPRSSSRRSISTWWWKNAKPGPEVPVHRGRQLLPERLRQRLGGDLHSEQQHRRLGRDHADERRATPARSRKTVCSRARSPGTTAPTSSRSTGTIYIDGDIRFDDNGQIVHYQGRAIIYASDDTEFDERVCAGGTGMTNCAASAATMAAWNPSTDLLTILAGNISTSQPCCPLQENAEFDHSTQGNDSSQGDDPAAPGAFQGIVYAAGNCQIHEQFLISGPVICNRISISDGDETDLPGRSRRSRRWARSWTDPSTSIRTTPTPSRWSSGPRRAKRPRNVDVVLARCNRASFPGLHSGAS